MRCTSFGERSNNINLKKIKITSFSLRHVYVLRDLIQTRTNNVISRKTQICILHRRHSQFTYVWRENEHRKIFLRWGRGWRKKSTCIMNSLCESALASFCTFQWQVFISWRRYQTEDSINRRNIPPNAFNQSPESREIFNLFLTPNVITPHPHHPSTNPIPIDQTTFSDQWAAWDRAQHKAGQSSKK